jgi:ABC-2 type transport system ATP-binding protein
MNENIVETTNLCKNHGAVMRVKNLNMAVPYGCVYGFL